MPWISPQGLARIVIFTLDAAGMTVFQKPLNTIGQIAQLITNHLMNSPLLYNRTNRTSLTAGAVRDRIAVFIDLPFVSN
jgi:hypothetical protein